MPTKGQTALMAILAILLASLPLVSAHGATQWSPDSPLTANQRLYLALVTTSNEVVTLPTVTPTATTPPSQPTATPTTAPTNTPGPTATPRPTISIGVYCGGQAVANAQVALNGMYDYTNGYGVAIFPRPANGTYPVSATYPNGDQVTNNVTIDANKFWHTVGKEPPCDW